MNKPKHDGMVSCKIKMGMTLYAAAPFLYDLIILVF